jgi:hypothetical protein
MLDFLGRELYTVGSFSEEANYPYVSSEPGGLVFWLF